MQKKERKMLTVEQVEAYVKNLPLQCKMCGSRPPHVIFEKFTYDKHYAYRKIRCNGCNSEYNEAFNVIDDSPDALKERDTIGGGR